MQMELVNVQRERNQLDQQRKLLKCTGPCAPCPCNPVAPQNVSRGFDPQSMGVPFSVGPQSGLPMKVPMQFLDCTSYKKTIDESSRCNELIKQYMACRINNRRS